MKYGLLHYAGDITKSLRVGELLGHDEEFRPYVVSDAEFQPETDRTAVHLQTASPDDLRRERPAP